MTTRLKHCAAITYRLSCVYYVLSQILALKSDTWWQQFHWSCQL